MAKQHPKKCKACGDKFTPSQFAQVVCSPRCAIDYTNKKKVKGQQKARRDEKNKDMQRLKELMSRTKWFAKLQVLVNQWVRYRDIDKPCCTCGTTRPIKYDAGHFHTVKARPDIRFELTQIHKQCSQKCNVYGSGMRNEYEKFMIKEYGQEHVDDLERLRPPLREQFPNWQDIEAEIKRYRKKLRDAGVKPHI